MNTPTAFSPSPTQKAVYTNQDPVVHFQDVSVVYRVPHERVSGIKEFTIRWLQRRLSYQEFWALHNISFDVQRGEVFG
ncbi:MAG TPA: hypothetical protein VF498_00490, partial [Anaerolineales bacterium]